MPLCAVQKQRENPSHPNFSPPFHHSAVSRTNDRTATADSPENRLLDPTGSLYVAVSSALEFCEA